MPQFVALCCCFVQLKQMEQKLQECRTKAGLMAEMQVRSSVDGQLILHCITFYCELYCVARELVRRYGDCAVNTIETNSSSIFSII